MRRVLYRSMALDQRAQSQFEVGLQVLYQLVLDRLEFCRRVLHQQLVPHQQAPSDMLQSF